MTRDAMRATILSAGNTRRSVSAMRSARMFDDGKLKAAAAGVADYTKTSLYKTVPVVAAWESIADVASKEGYEFRVPARNPRNPKNAPRPDEERLLNLMENGKLPEYFAMDEPANEIFYAPPIALSADYLLCHGDPSASPAGNGEDMRGFPVESWRDGDRHGIFPLRSKLDRVDSVVRAGIRPTALWLLPLSFCVGLGVFFLISKISNRLAAIIQSISDGSGQLTSAVVQIAASSQAPAQGSSRPAASLEETSAASEQIACMINKNAGNSRSAAVEMDGGTPVRAGRSGRLAAQSFAMSHWQNAMNTRRSANSHPPSSPRARLRRPR